MKNNNLIKQTTFNSAEKLDILFNEIYKKTYNEILQMILLCVLMGGAIIVITIITSIIY